MQALREFAELAIRYPIGNVDAIEDIRRRALAVLVSRHGSVRKLAAALERSESQLSQWLNASPDSKTGKARNISTSSCRYIEDKLSLDRYWMDSDHSGEGHDVGKVAHDMSQAKPTVRIRRLEWDRLMTEELNEPFELEVIDDALAPEIFRGCIVRLVPVKDRAPVAGRPVLVKDLAGSYYLRDFEVKGERWRAVARQRGYAPLDSLDDKLELIAVMKGFDWP